MVYLFEYDALQFDWLSRIPNLVFDNSLDDDFIQIDSLLSLKIRQKGKATSYINSQLQENEIYSGNENPLILSRIYELIFHCEFELRNFPFDTQICLMAVNNYILPFYSTEEAS